MSTVQADITQERLESRNHNLSHGHVGAYRGYLSPEQQLTRPQAGSLVVSYVSSPLATWSCLVLLLSIHLAMNRAAVKSVSMHSLNRQR